MAACLGKTCSERFSYKSPIISTGTYAYTGMYEKREVTTSRNSEFKRHKVVCVERDLYASGSRVPLERENTWDLMPEENLVGIYNKPSLRLQKDYSKLPSEENVDA